MGKVKKLEKSTIKKVCVLLLCIVAFLYIVYLLYGANFSMVKTETVSFAAAADSINADCYVVRSETLITNDTNGVVSYEFDGNRKVAKGGVIAKVYANEQDANNHKQMDQLQQQIGIFQRLNKSAKKETTGLDSIRNQIASNIIDINKNIVNGNVLSLTETDDDLKYALNESMIILGEVTDYSNKVASLQKEYDSLKGVTGEAIAEIKSPASGYFTTNTDGYEKKFNYKTATSTDLAQAQAGLEVKPDKVADNVIGKVVSNLNWYLICPIKADESLAINRNMDSSSIRINMPYAATQSVPVQIAAMNQESKTSDGALVLQCNYMNPVLSSLRQEELKIDIQTYEGLKISKNALHEDVVTVTVTDENGKETEQSKKVKGVYVINGNVMQFKEVVIAYATDDYYICKQNPEPDELFSDSTIELYDRVVVGGTDLYDGKGARV